MVGFDMGSERWGSLGGKDGVFWVWDCWAVEMGFLGFGMFLGSLGGGYRVSGFVGDLAADAAVAAVQAVAVVIRLTSAATDRASAF
ncbi:hypothetical protein LWI29_029093 [Acer saccharum]|uniref:Uncharacterized protein n=1 Tax=Acer saccharum TaxID=4024 RepID=A0AA39V9J9_ACESA|nr:hypothetical protein LWI29_029093 [Acer saccharum]